MNQKKRKWNMKNRIILCAFIASLLFGILLLLSPQNKVNILEKESSGENYFIIYSDLDNDGNSEKLFFQKDNFGNVGLIVYKDNEIIDHWNFEGKIAKINKPFLGDIDKDGELEICIFTQIQDSILVHCVDPLKESIVFKNRFITLANKKKGRYDYRIFPGIMYDNNKDGYKELYFTINTGYTTYPRNVFVYNFINDTVTKSPESCAALFAPKFHDFDKDSSPEIFFSTHALGNCDFDKPFTDQFGWLMLLNPDLEFIFNPIPFEAYPSQTEVSIMRNKDRDLIFVCHIYNGIKNFKSFLALYDNNGKLINKRILPEKNKIKSLKLTNKTNDHSNLYLFTNTGIIYKVNNKLELKEFAHIPKCIFLYEKWSFDVNGNGLNEQLFIGEERNNLVIVNDRYKNSVTVDFGDKIKSPLISIIESTEKKPEIFVCTDNFSYRIKYSRTFVYKYWYIVLFILFTTIHFTFYLYLKVKDYRHLKHKSEQKKISDAQLRLFQNQLDPHFTFNVLNVFGNLIHEQNTEKAEFIFNNYTRILKSVIINGDKIMISLYEELQFVKNYLELEVYRSGEKFEYELNFDQAVCMKIYVPKMMIHNFVENSVKHGVFHLKTKGKISILVIQNTLNTYIQIEDNGIGRKKAASLSTYSTGIGLNTIDQILLNLKKSKRIDIKYAIEDLFIDEEAAGTLVKVTIPKTTKEYE